MTTFQRQKILFYTTGCGIDTKVHQNLKHVKTIHADIYSKLKKNVSDLEIGLTLIRRMQIFKYFYWEYIRYLCWLL